MRDRLALLFLILLLAGCGGKVVTLSEDQPVTNFVVGVTDGDNIRLRYRIMYKDGDKIKYATSVRYIGVSAPGKSEPYYNSAKELNKTLVGGKTVRLEFDAKVAGQSGTVLAYVFVDNIFVNAEMIRRGYARADPVSPNTKYAELFGKMEREAKEAKRGIWQPSSERHALQRPVEGGYVASKYSKVFHVPSCPAVGMIADENRIYFRTFKEAVDSGRTPCKVCKPEDTIKLFQSLLRRNP